MASINNGLSNVASAASLYLQRLGAVTADKPQRQRRRCG